MATAPQITIRRAPRRTDAPPAAAAMPPNIKRLPRESNTVKGTTLLAGASNIASNGTSAPKPKATADAKAACKGLALRVSLIPNSSRAWASRAP